MNEEINHIIASSKSKYNFYCYTHHSDRVLAYNEQAITETASTIKLLIMAYAFKRADQGELDLNKPVKVLPKDIGGLGSGILPIFSLRSPIEIQNLIVLMMTVSDNVATNVLIRILGQDSINEYAKSIGLAHTKLDMKFISFDESFRLRKTKVGISTAKEMGQLVGKILAGELFSGRYIKLAKSLMDNIQGSRLIRRIPFTIDGKNGSQEFGSKTGTLIDLEGNYLFSECGFVVDKNKKQHVFSLFATGKLPEKLPLSVDSAAAQEFIKVGELLYYALERGSHLGNKYSPGGRAVNSFKG